VRLPQEHAEFRYQVQQAYGAEAYESSLMEPGSPAEPETMGQQAQWSGSGSSDPVLALGPLPSAIGGGSFSERRGLWINIHADPHNGGELFRELDGQGVHAEPIKDIMDRETAAVGLPCGSLVLP